MVVGRSPTAAAATIIPYQEPPLVMPYCALCDLPVDRYVMDIPTSWTHVGITGSCCGKTQSRRLSQEDIHRLHTSGEKLYLIVAKGHAQEIRAQKRRRPK